ncbi:MAG: hypothetical protein U0R19_40300 [Bryobacteraceae bacterium]
MRNSQQKRRVDSPHFSDAEWADYTRGLSSPELWSQFQQHLQSGCERCHKQHQYLQQVKQSASASVEVPDDVVQRAQALFDRAPRLNWIDRLQALTAQLVSRSPLELHPVGVRSVAPDVQSRKGERLLFSAGVYHVDLKLDWPLTAGAAEIIGQISNSSDEHESFENVPVQIEVSGRVVLEAPANRFGEFLLVHPLKQNQTTLRLGLQKAGLRIEVPLRSRRTRSGRS